ncbi:CatA-like O-acetyltransferase [Pseudoduganella sp. HUAS MS19]
MDKFEYRRDRYEAFRQYANPLLNLSVVARLPEFRHYCKERQLPPFHFLLYCLYMSVKDVDNFLYREFEGEVIRIDDFYGAYTVLNLDNNLNYARFDMSNERGEFISRSLAAGVEARATRELINTGRDLALREQKNNVYTTCMPWLDMRAIEHPIYQYKSADIPLIAWGRYSDLDGDTMTVPFCVQAHHGFVDGYHVHLLLQRLGERIAFETGL